MYKQGKCVYLSGLANELIEEKGKKKRVVHLQDKDTNDPTEPHADKLSQQFLDRIIVARLSLDPNESHDELPKDIANGLYVLHFDYLLNCWKQAYDIRKNTLLRSKVIISIILPLLLSK